MKQTKSAGVILLVSLLIIVIGMTPCRAEGYNLAATWGGRAPGALIHPADFTFDSAGNVFVADTGNHRIQKFASNGNFLAEWGTQGSSVGQFQSPNGLFIDSADNVFVADAGNYRMQKFASNGNFIKSWGSEGLNPGQFKNIVALAVDVQGNVYVGEKISFASDGRSFIRLQKFDTEGNVLLSINELTVTEDYDTTVVIDVDSAQNIYVYDSNFLSYLMIFNADGTLQETWAGDIKDGEFSSAASIAVGRNDKVFVGDAGNSAIQVFDQNGTVLAKWGGIGANSSQFSSISDITTDSLGNVYVADSENKCLQKFTESGAFLLKWQFDLAPYSVAVDTASNMYIIKTPATANWWERRIAKYDINGNKITTWKTPSLYSPNAITLDASGNLYVADEGEVNGGNRLQKLDSAGNLLKAWDLANEVNPNITEIALDASNNVYLTILTFNDSVVKKYDSAGNYITTVDSTSPGHYYLHSLSLNSAGEVYVLDGSSLVSRFTPALYSLKGQLKDSQGAAMPNVIVNLSGSKNATTLTDATGNYEFTGLAIGNYEITPSQRGYYFDKDTITFTALNTNLENQNFTEVLYPTYSVNTTINISGKVTDVYGAAVANATVHLAGGNLLAEMTTVTTADGNYTFALPIMHDPGTYTLTVSKEGYRFTAITLSNVKTNMDNGTNIQNQNFAETRALSSTNEFKIMGGEQGYVNTANGEKAQFVINHEDSGLLAIKVYDLTGALVWETSKEVTGNSTAIITWDGRNNYGEQIASGIYIAHIADAGIKQTKKIAVIK